MMPDLGSVQCADGSILARNRRMGDLIKGIPADCADMLCDLAYVDGSDVVLAFTARNGKATTVTLRGAADMIAQTLVLG